MARRTEEEIADAGVAEVMRPEFNISDEEMMNLDSFDAAIELATAKHGAVTTSKAVRIAGDAEKAKLVGLPILLMEWHFVVSDGRFGDKGREYVEVLCAVKEADGGLQRWKITDGSTGIAKQLRAYTDKTGTTGGVFVPNGIRVSEYPLDPATRQPMTRDQQRAYDTHNRPYPMGRTYYVDL